MFPMKHKQHSQEELCKQKNKWLNILATQEQELELAEDLTDVQGSSIVGGTTVTRGRVASSAQGVVGR
ncbi:MULTISPECIES: hypothetical protein [Nostocales]|uniref:Uncharacterized protein n=3 Tax=Nostocales TaxID=1161 RepID=A0A0C1R446_9CYAN|nr:hypothetical protein [Tolypothrix bouteillei]KAF3889505.1 hypothetical protein DA73_0400031535 [Tolypothrix bouteillei VB521301]